MVRNLHETELEFCMDELDSDRRLDLTMDNTLSSSDLPFSQELSRDFNMQSSSEDSFHTGHDSAIPEEEVNFLNTRTVENSEKRMIDYMERTEVIMEDYNSLLFTDYMNEFMANAECGLENPSEAEHIALGEGLGMPEIGGGSTSRTVTCGGRS